jgi:hypothetical protein
MEARADILNRETVKRDRDKFFPPVLCCISSRAVEVIDVSSATILVAERGVAEIEQIPSFRFPKSKGDVEYYRFISINFAEKSLA